MIPKPPYPWDFTPQRAQQEFAVLKQRLRSNWVDVYARDDSAHTIVVVPSFTLDQAELAKIRGLAFYEERLLFFLIKLRNPLARMVYVTSQPIHPQVLDYYLQLLAGVPASHARARLTLLCAYDASPRSLTEKILGRPRLLERIRGGIVDLERAYLTTYNATALERHLAVVLGIPLEGADPELTHFGSKSGGRRVFREAGVSCPDGVEDVHSEQDVIEALRELKGRRPDLSRAVLKLDESFSGEGNVLVDLPDAASGKAIDRALDNIVFAVSTETRESYFEKLARMGGVVEEFVDGTDASSPSVQLWIDPQGEVSVTSTHEQVLGGRTGLVYSGCRFPSRAAYRSQLASAGLAVGRVLADKGVVSRASVDFVAIHDPSGDWRLEAVEINLRMGGTTHPMMALSFLTGGELDADTGLFDAPDGRSKYYRATDRLESVRYEGLLPEDLIEILIINRLAYNYRSATGVLFHMIGALSEFGKIGIVAIGDSREEAETIFDRTAEILDHETRFRPGLVASAAAPVPSPGPRIRPEIG